MPAHVLTDGTQLAAVERMSGSLISKRVAGEAFVARARIHSDVLLVRFAEGAVWQTVQEAFTR